MFAANGTTAQFYVNADGSTGTARNQFRVSKEGNLIIDSASTDASTTIVDFKSANNSGNSVGNIKANGDANFGGGGTFAGQVEIGKDIASGSGVRLYKTGALYLRSDVEVSNSIFKYYNGGFGDDDVRINFKADGSSEFAGNVSVGTPSEGGSTTGVKVQANGKLVATRSGSDDQLFEGYQTGDTSANVVITAGGSASFNNTIHLNSNGSIVTSGADDNSYILQGKKGSAKNIELFANGEGYFASGLYAGGRDTSSTTAAGVDANGTGSLYIQGKGTTGDGATIFQYSRGTDAANIKFTANGAATFAGTVQVGGNANAGIEGVNVFSEGSITVCRNGTDVAFNTKAEGSTTTTSQILANGDASFAGEVFLANATVRATTVSTSGVLSLFNGSGDKKAEINGGDGSANFDGVVTASNITSFKSKLVTAVTAAATLADLKTAIIDALADL